MNNENRGQGELRIYNGGLYVAINVNTQGIQDKISMIKLFHYVNNTKGYLIEVEYSSNNFILPISGNNA